METREISGSGTLSDVTNTDGKQTYQPPVKRSLSGGNGIKNLKRTLFGGERVYEESESETIRSVKAHDAYKQTKKKANPCDLQSLRDVKSQGEILVDELCLKGASSSQIIRLKSKADDSTFGSVPSLDCEAEADSPTESDEDFLGHPAISFTERNDPTFSYQTSLNCTQLNKEKDDVGVSSANEKLQGVNLCCDSSCSSCMKAAHMWMDLMYQDTRGRLNALNCSRKRARIIGAKIIDDDKAGDTSQIITKETASVESDLRQHWTSLILHTEDSLQREVMQTARSKVSKYFNCYGCFLA
ncbi:hypothetical protein HPP92_004303 [Vanilla planifolia]|uniref:Uncharacterized protein n=1 Tax=Vanilla planifolia TaxID=51239 RepID=A0A835VI01_VANPL|nr:hypothetical protein HPP92_004303 [Vanilla planifolia]